MWELIRLFKDGDFTFFKKVREFKAYDVLYALANNNTIGISHQLNAQVLLKKVNNKTPLNLELEMEQLYIERYMDVIFSK